MAEAQVEVYQSTFPTGIKSESDLEKAVKSIKQEPQYLLTRIAKGFIEKFKQSTKCYVDNCELSLPELLVFDNRKGPSRIQDAGAPDISPYELIGVDSTKRIHTPFDVCSIEDPFCLRYNNDCMVSYFFQVPNLNARGNITDCAIRLRYHDSLIRLDCIKKTLSAIAEEYKPILQEFFEECEYA